MPDTTTSQECQKCKKMLPFSEFPAFQERYKFYRGLCRACREVVKVRRRRDHWYRSEYGISLDDYEKMLKKQGGRCAICRTDSPGGPHNTFGVDHCHRTGQVRGLLCNTCNIILGSLGDNLEGIMRFVNYLRWNGGIIIPLLGSKRRGKPFQPVVVRYVDGAGKRCPKGTPGARVVRHRLKGFYAKINGKRVPLGTEDREHAMQRLRQLRGG